MSKEFRNSGLSLKPQNPATISQYGEGEEEEREMTRITVETKMLGNGEKRRSRSGRAALKKVNRPLQ